MDKLISIKGLVIRSTSVIPDMKTGTQESPFHHNIKLMIIKLSSDVRSATTQSMCPSIGARLQSQRDAQGKLVSRKIQCR